MADPKGILTKPAAIALGVLMLFGGAVVVGWKARDVITDAVASPRRAPSRQDGKESPLATVDDLRILQDELTRQIDGIRADVRSDLQAFDNRVRAVELKQATQDGIESAHQHQ